MQQRYLISFIIALFVVSSTYLLFVSHNLEERKNWWSVYFSNPKDLSRNFVIENHTSNTNFHYEIFDGKYKVNENDIIIKKGDVRKLDVTHDVPKVEQDKITIIVTNGEEKKEIYKNYNFDK